MRTSLVSIEGVDFVLIRAEELNKFIHEVSIRMWCNPALQFRLSDACDGALVPIKARPAAKPPDHGDKGKSLVVASGPPPKKRALPPVASSSSRSARPADDGQATYKHVLDLIRAKGDADVAAIVEALEAEGFPFGEDRIRQVSGIFHIQLRPKGLIEKVEGKRGYWKATGA